MRGIERSAAARGGLASGNTLVDLSRYNQGLASQQFGRYADRLAGLAGTGQSSAENLAGQRMQLGAQIGANSQNAANARASGIQGAGNAYANAAGQIAGFGGWRFGGPQNQLVTGYGGPGAGMGVAPQGIDFNQMQFPVSRAYA